MLERGTIIKKIGDVQEIDFDLTLDSFSTEKKSRKWKKLKIALIPYSSEAVMLISASFQKRISILSLKIAMYHGQPTAT